MSPFEQMPTLVVPGQSNSRTVSRIRVPSGQWFGSGEQHRAPKKPAQIF